MGGCAGGRGKNHRPKVSAPASDSAVIHRAGRSHLSFAHIPKAGMYAPPAEETLADRRYFGLNAKQWAAFMAALDASPRELPRLKKLFQERSVFESA